MFLFLNLEKDYSSFIVYNYFKSDQDKLFKSLQYSLQISVLLERTKCNETQITLLVRTLLELFDDRVKIQQYGFIENYTIIKNTNLYVSIFNVTRSRQFGDFDLKEMYKMLSKSITFSEIIISI